MLQEFYFSRKVLAQVEKKAYIRETMTFSNSYKQMKTTQISARLCVYF